MKTEVRPHILVITIIHDKWANGEPFAIHQLVKLTGASTSSVTRIVMYLRTMLFLVHSAKAFNGKHYRVSATWPATAALAIDAYEMSKLTEGAIGA